MEIPIIPGIIKKTKKIIIYVVVKKTKKKNIPNSKSLDNQKVFFKR